MAALPSQLIWSPSIAFHDPSIPITIEDGQMVGARQRAALCEDLFEYLPLAAPAWAGSLRRAPMIQVRDLINDSPNSSTFTDTEEPVLGADVQMDIEGTGRLMGGIVQSYEVVNDGDAKDSWAYPTTIADYLFNLNERRPFICFENIPADQAVTQMFTAFAPSDFTLNIEATTWPNVTVKFNGDQTFTECLSVIMNRVNGHFKCDYDKVLQVRLTEGVTENPADVDDDNDDLIWDTPPTMKVDASQIRNRVFVKGAAAKLLADAAPGATELEVDGIDVFNPNGGTAIIGCQRITYTGVNRTLIYPPPDASQMTGPPIQAQQYVSPGNLYEEGPIRTEVRYSASYVFNGKEGPRSSPLGFSLFRFNPGFGLSATFVPGSGFLPLSAREWCLAFRSNGGLYYDHNIGRTSGGGNVPGGSMVFNWNAGSGISNDVRPQSVVLFRKANIPGGDPGPPGNQNGWFYEVASQPYIPGVTSYPFTDGKADASLGNALPWDESPHPLRYDTIGARVVIQTLSARNTASNNGAQQLKIYREERFNGIDFTGNSSSSVGWTSPKVVMTFDTTQNITASDPLYHEDTNPTTAHLYANGESPVNSSSPVPPPPQPKVRLVLFGVSGLTETVHEGDDVEIFVQRDDLTAQIFWAQKRGGNGVREYMITDRNLRSDAELIARGDAELTLFAMPIITVTYATRDTRSVTGTFVNFNLTQPPIVASLRIQESTIDQIHEADNLSQRYNVVASSVKFTLEDLLRRALIRQS